MTGPLSSCCARASHGGGFSCCRAQALGCLGFSRCSPWAQHLWLLGSRTQAQVAVAHGLSCPGACGTRLTQGSSPCPLRWQLGSLPLKPHPFFSSWAAAPLLRPLPHLLTISFQIKFENSCHGNSGPFFLLRRSSHLRIIHIFENTGHYIIQFGGVVMNTLEIIHIKYVLNNTNFFLSWP